MDIRLRTYQVDDLTALVENADNPKVCRYLRERFPSPFTAADGKWWIEEGSCLPNTLNYAIVVNGEFVGGIGAHFFQDERRHSAEIGYWLGEAHWGKGFAAGAVDLFCRELFQRDDIHRLFAPVAAPNIGSIRVLEKCGFQHEGIMRQAMALRGRLYDQHLFAKLKG